MTDVADALELEDAPDLDDDEQRERWKVKSDRAASWALRRLGAAAAEIERIKQNADDEITAIKAWAEAATAEPKRDINFFEGVLIDYRMRLEADNPKLPQTYKVPGGTIARRKTPDKIEIVDPEKLVRWAIRSGLFDILKIEPQVSKLKDIGATAQHDEIEPEDEGGTGPPFLVPVGRMVIGEGDDIEIVPGVVHLIREDSYSAKPG